MDTRQMKKKLKKIRRRISSAFRTVIVRMQDRRREAIARNMRKRGLMGQAQTLTIHNSRHDIEIRTKRDG